MASGNHKRQIVIAGGGFFGCSIALMLRQRGWQPVIVEENRDLLTRASCVNQARVHGGYHYPRSLMTAYRSRRNYERFREKYREAIVDSFTKVYAVSRYFSKVTAGQFEMFMKRVGAPLKDAPPSIVRLFNPALTEKCWIADECAFDFSILRKKLRRGLEEAGVELRFGDRVTSAHAQSDGAVAQLSGGGEIPCRMIFNATYAGLNLLTSASGSPVVSLKHELAEMALIELPDELKGLSVTMMCGPFFSFMPYPARGLTTLSHVRYTPHAQWLENARDGTSDPYRRFDALTKESHQELMLADGSRYLPSLRGATYRESIWAVKTLLPQTETDDGRPILFQQDPLLPAVVHVMGGKIDNIFDVEDELVNFLSKQTATAA